MLTSLSLFLLFALLITLAWLEQTSLLQTFLLRPLLILPFMGFMNGELPQAVMLATLLELLFLADPPLGAHLPPEPAPAALTAWGAMMLSEGGRLLPGIIIAIVMAYVWPRFSGLIRSRNHRESELWQQYCEHGNRREFERHFRRVLIRDFLGAFAMAAIALSASWLVLSLPVPVPVVEYLDPMTPLFTGVIIAVAVMQFYRDRNRIPVFGGILLGVMLLFLLNRGGWSL